MGSNVEKCIRCLDILPAKPILKTVETCPVQTPDVSNGLNETPYGDVLIVAGFLSKLNNLGETPHQQLSVMRRYF